MTKTRCWLAAVALAGCGSAAPNRDGAMPVDVRARLTALGAVPCAADPAFECFSLPAPLSHAAPNDGRMINIAFAVHPAPTATRTGTLVNAAGGPGYGGTDALDDYSGLSDRFPQELDIVYFDLRGVGGSGGFECAKAASTLYLGGMRAASATEESTVLAKSIAFASDCVAEMGIAPDRLAYYNTVEAAEDLESFRNALGLDKLSLYGLSYGTQLMQTYAARHPDRVARLVLDGAVDLSLEHVAYSTSEVQSVSALLDRTLEDCASRTACLADFAGAPGAIAADRVSAGYAAIAGKLDAGPVTLSWPGANGGTPTRYFSRADLDTTSANALADPTMRKTLASAVGAAYGRDDFMPLLALLYASTGTDPERAGAIGSAAADPAMSDAAYYTFTCNDYRAGGDDAQRIQAYLDGGRVRWATDSRIVSPYYGDLPCVTWPVSRPAAARTADSLAGVPTIVVNATGDAFVPYVQGRSVAARLSDGYLVEIDGGWHVMYGGGLPCIDDPVNAFLLDGTRPRARQTNCTTAFVDP